MPDNLPAVAFTYNGIDFVYDADGLINLTAMWRAIGSPENKNPNDWGRTEQGSGFIADLAQSSNTAKNRIWKSRRGQHLGGTWGHWQIALAYAKYLSHEFHRIVNDGFRQHVEEKADPGLKIDRGIDGYIKQGFGYDWVDKRLKGKITHKKLTSKMKSLGAVQQTYREVAEIGNVKVIGWPAHVIKEKRNPPTGQTRDSFTDAELVSMAFYESQTDESLDTAGVYGHDEIKDVALMVGNAVRNMVQETQRLARQIKEGKSLASKD